MRTFCQLNEQRSTEAAGCSLVSVIVDHIFLCIKDAGKDHSEIPFACQVGFCFLSESLFCDEFTNCNYCQIFNLNF